MQNMENTAVNQLPEVDSLPDGFVDSSAEPFSPSTPTIEQEKLVSDCKEEKLLETCDKPHLPIEDLQCGDNDTGKTHKTRTFPVPLSEDNSLDASEKPSESLDKHEETGSCIHSEKACKNNADPEVANLKGNSSSEVTANNKKRELSEGKRKNAKRSLKLETELLEFTLKYQQVLAERDAAIAVRDKLESLCRELQRQNKMLMDECKRVSTEGQSLRLDLSTRFQDAIKEVNNKLEEQKDECLSQLKENEMLRSKLKELAEQYALSEQQYEHKLKQKTLELQIADLQMQQHEEKLVQEQSQMKLYAEQVTQLLATEKNLRLQLMADGDKFQQFQEALVKSNEVFEAFKQRMEKMGKSIEELKKENTFLKSKCENSDITLVQLLEEREHMKKQLEKTGNQKEALESLCRSLQAERKRTAEGENISDQITT